MKLGNLASRLLTAAVLVPLVIAAILWSRHEGLWALIFVVTVLGLREFGAMWLDEKPDRNVLVVLGTGLAVVAYWVPGGMNILLPAAVLLPALWCLSRPGNIPDVPARMGSMAFGLIYAAALPTTVSLLKKDFGAHGGDWVLIVLTIGWAGDTVAYFTGRAIGGPKLYPTVSPAKTWSGAVGGLIGSVLAMVVAHFTYFPELSILHGVVLGAVGAVLGQSGDLVESLMKRARGVKDSGNILPGHGGMLDRIDAVLFVAPWVYLYAHMVWRS